MGQDQSSFVDDRVPPQTLENRSIAAVARYIKDANVKRIVVMVRQLSQFGRSSHLIDVT